MKNNDVTKIKIIYPNNPTEERRAAYKEEYTRYKEQHDIKTNKDKNNGDK